MSIITATVSFKWYIHTLHSITPRKFFLHILLPFVSFPKKVDCLWAELIFGALRNEIINAIPGLHRFNFERILDIIDQTYQTVVQIELALRVRIARNSDKL